VEALPPKGSYSVEPVCLQPNTGALHSTCTLRAGASVLHHPLCSVCSAPLTPDEIEHLLASAHSGASAPKPSTAAASCGEEAPEDGAASADGSRGASTLQGQSHPAHLQDKQEQQGPAGVPLHLGNQKLRHPARVPLAAVLASGSCLSCRLHLSSRTPSLQKHLHSHQGADAPPDCILEQLQDLRHILLSATY